jgi:uncharacterized protein
VAVILVLLIVIGGVVGVFMLLQPSSSYKPEPGIPKLEYYTTDLVGVLTYNDLVDIDAVCEEVGRNSSSEMAVVVVNSTYPYDIDYYALRTFQYNQIGKAGKDNGVLIVVATEDKTWRIEVGYGLEGILTDTRVNRLAHEYLEPNMTAGFYGDGLFWLTLNIGQIIEDEYTGDRSGGPAFEVFGYGLTWTEIAIIVVVFIVLTIITRGRAIYPILWILSLITGGRGGGGFGGGRSGGGGASGRL